jgi:hypothetical protein
MTENALQLRNPHQQFGGTADFSASNNDFDSSCISNIVQRIRGQNYQVGELSRLDPTQMSLLPKHGRIILCGRL